jgi:hypothetical protein
MDEPMMTNEELNAWRLVGADMGLEFDELGHPYKPGMARDQLTLEFYQGAYDWRPLEDDSDCLRLIIHYELKLCCDSASVLVANSRAGAASMGFWTDRDNRSATLRLVVFNCAVQVVRAKLAKLDSVNTRTLNKL